MRKRPAKVQIALLTTVSILLLAAVASFNRQTSAQPNMPADQAHFVPPPPMPTDQAHFVPPAVPPAKEIPYLEVVKPLAKGSVVTKDSIALLHGDNLSLQLQGHGHTIKSEDLAIGRKVTRDLKVGDTLQPSDLESPASAKKAKR